MIVLDSGRDVRGGGVLCYVRSCLHISNIIRSKVKHTKETEYICFKILLEKNQHLLFVSAYRPPHGDSLYKLFDVISNQGLNCIDTIITGDLNSHLESINPESRNLRRLCKESNIHILDTGPSYYLRFILTWLDVVLISDLSKVASWEKSHDPFICWHDYLFFQYKIDIAKHRYSFKFRKFDIKSTPKFEHTVVNTLNSVRLMKLVNADMFVI